MHRILVQAKRANNFNIGWLMHRTLCGMLAGAPRFSPAAWSGKHVHQRHLIRFRARQKARAASMIVTP